MLNFGKGGGSSGPSMAQMEASQMRIMQEQMAMQQQMQLDAEERAQAQRVAEREAELERQREAEREKAELMAQEELREQMIMNEADVPEQDELSVGDLNLDVPLIESPDYGKDKNLE